MKQAGPCSQCHEPADRVWSHRPASSCPPHQAAVEAITLKARAFRLAMLVG
ncbi:MAG TPA: hypothetical protein PLE74_12065 [Candidatus Cloacimonadota bacterium]|nr:hypothetical protein [Candidatus Cloacimonadota bacterium]